MILKEQKVVFTHVWKGLQVLAELESIADLYKMGGWTISAVSVIPKDGTVVVLVRENPYGV